MVALADLLFPPRCVGCGRSGRYFCDPCWAGVRHAVQTICPQCGRPSAAGLAHARCRKKYGLDGVCFLFAYEELIKKTVKKLKYRRVTKLVEELAGRLKPADFAHPILDKQWTLVPVPLHRRRENERGFNQAALLGEALASRFSWEFIPDLLVRTRWTRPQAYLKKAKRLKNMAGAFAIRPRHPIILSSCHPNILLFDDIWTTGATLRECGKVVKKAGAETVWALTLAR